MMQVANISRLPLGETCGFAGSASRPAASMRRFVALLAVAVAAALAFTLPAAAYAEENAEGVEWEVVFTGSSIDASFHDDTIDEVVATLLPGDTATFTVTLENRSQNAADWYMKNTVIKSFEETQKTRAGAVYSYSLVIQKDGEETVLYNSESIGDFGDGVTFGLKEAIASMQNYFFLTSMEPGESGRVVLTIALDGEAQGNSFSDAFAQMEMNFGAEEVLPGEESAGGHLTSTDGQGPGFVRMERGLGSLAQTGDRFLPAMVAFCVAGLAGLVLLIVAIAKSRRRDGEEASNA